MKSIVLHRAASDNVGGYQDAGTELLVSGQKVAGHIAADRAKALVDEGGAVDFGKDEKEAILAAVSDAVKDGVIAGAPPEKAGKGD